MEGCVTFSYCFILVSVLVVHEPFPGTLTVSHTRAQHTHVHTSGQSSIANMPPCYREIGGGQTTQRKARTNVIQTVKSAQGDKGEAATRTVSSPCHECAIYLKGGKKQRSKKRKNFEAMT